MAEESEVQPVNKTYNTIEPEVNMPSGKFWTILEILRKHKQFLSVGWC